MVLSRHLILGHEFFLQNLQIYDSMFYERIRIMMDGMDMVRIEASSDYRTEFMRDGNRNGLHT